MAAVLVVQLWATRTAQAVSILADETGYLADARYLARAGVPFNLGTVTYYRPGYALLAVPLYAVLDDPATIYRAMILVNVALVTVTVPLAYVLARRLFTMGRTTAASVAAIVTLYPAWTLQSNFVWSEALFAPLFLVLTIGVHEVAVLHTRRGAVLVGITAPALSLTHGRGLAPTAVVLVAFAAAGATRLIPRLDAAIGAALVVAGLAAGRVLDTRLTAVLFEGDRRPDGELADSLSRASDVTSFALTLAGHLWYALVATAGVAGLGALALAVRLRRRTGTETSWRHPDSAHALAAGAILALVASVMLTSSLFMTDRPRADHLVYGRYNDAALAPLLVCGLGWLAVHRRRRHLAAAGLAVTLAMGVCGTALALSRQTELLDRPFNTVTVMGIYPWVAAFGGPHVGPITLVALALLLAVLVAARWRREVALLVTAALAIGSIAWIHHAFLANKTNGLPVVEQVAVVTDLVDDETSSAAFAQTSERTNLLFWAYQFYLPEMRFTRFRLDLGVDPGHDLIWAGVRQDDPLFLGSRIAYLDPLAGMALHVRPGPRQDEMAARGVLLPGGWPSVLPIEAGRGDLDIIEAPTVSGDGALTATLRVTHTGTGSPWPATGTPPTGVPTNPTGAVRVVVRVMDPACACQVVERRAELPRMLYPGDDPVEVPVDLTLDDLGLDLDPGRYEVRFELAQENIAVLPISASADVEVP